MVYDVRVVEDTELPAGQDWVLVTDNGRVTFAVKKSAAGSPQVMADGWAAYRRLLRRRAVVKGDGRRLRVVV